MLVKKNKEHP